MLSSKVGGFAAFAIGSTTAAGFLASRLEIYSNSWKFSISGAREGFVSKHGNGRNRETAMKWRISIF